MGAQFSSFFSKPSLPLAFTNHFTGRLLSVDLVADGKLLSPAQLRAQIKRPIELIKAEAYFFAQRSPRHMHCPQEALLPLASIFVGCPPCVSMRVMFHCVAITCQRLATAPADMHMVYKAWGWAEVVLERVTRGRVKKVQVWLQRRACCAVAALVVPVLACAVCLTRAAGNGGWF